MKNIDKIIIILLFSLAAGFFLSRALVSFATIIFFVTAIYWQTTHKNLPVSIKQFDNRSTGFIAFYLIILVCSWAALQPDCLIEPLLFFSPCLLLPVSLEFLKSRLQKLKTYIHSTNWIFIVATLLLLLETVIKQGFNSVAVTQLAEEGKNVRNSLGIHHNIVGFLAVFSIIYISYSLKQQLQIWKFVILIVFVFLIHYLGLRFAIISFYPLMLIFLARLKVNISIKAYAVALGIALVLASFTFSPAFNARYQYTRNDLENIIKGGNPNYWSINQRLIADGIAYDIAKKHWIFGVGTCNIKGFFASEYEKNSRLLIPQNRIFIHNQLLYGWATYGILYVMAWLLLFGYLTYRGIQEKSILLEITLLFLMHQLIEKTLEKQLMLMLLLYFVMVMPKGLEENRFKVESPEPDN